MAAAIHEEKNIRMVRIKFWIFKTSLIFQTGLTACNTDVFVCGIVRCSAIWLECWLKLISYRQLACDVRASSVTGNSNCRLTDLSTNRLLCVSYQQLQIFCTANVCEFKLKTNFTPENPSFSNCLHFAQLTACMQRTVTDFLCDDTMFAAFDTSSLTMHVPDSG